MKQVLIGLALLLFSQAAMSQKIPVFIEATNEEGDSAGRLLVYEIKEGIRGSHGYTLVSNENEWPYVRLIIVSISAAVGERNLGTAYSYTIVYDDISLPLDGLFLTSGVQICPTKEVAYCARSKLATLEGAATNLQRRVPAMHKALLRP